jgi:drug/metabolite transporter (DMT)-like permease
MPASLRASAQDRPSIVQKTQSWDGKVKPCKYSTGLRRLALPVVCSSKRKAGLHCVRPDAATPASVTARGVEVLDTSIAKAAIAIFKSPAVFNRETPSSLCGCFGPDRNIGSRSAAAERIRLRGIADSFFFALTHVDPAICNTIHGAMGPLTVVVLGARGVALAKPEAISRIEYAGYVGIAVSVIGLWWVVLGGYSGLALTDLVASVAGLALLSVSGISITISLLYCKRLQDRGIGADAVTAARYLLLILFAGTVVLWHSNFGDIATPRQFTLLSAATAVLIVFPLYAYQLGIGRTTPLTAQVIRALGPVFVFALEQFDGRLHYSLPTLACILVYSASVFVSNIAHGWSDESRRSRRRAEQVQSQFAQQQS